MSLNCLKASQGFFGILTILGSCLAASFMNKSKPILFWEISCSMFFRRFQQYWPHRVPMHWGVRLSFILIVMTHHSCTHFGDLCWQSSSIRIIGKNKLPLPFSRRNGSLREKGRLAKKMLSVFAQVSLLLIWLETWGAQVSLLRVLDCFTQDPLPSDFWSYVSNSTLDLSAALGMWFAPANRLFPLEIMT